MLLNGSLEIKGIMMSDSGSYLNLQFWLAFPGNALEERGKGIALLLLLGREIQVSHSIYVDTWDYFSLCVCAIYTDLTIS